MNDTKRKVLVFNGSPKKEGSDTMHLTRAFLAGMEESSQNEIEIIHIAEKHIEFCSGCLGCMRNGGQCIHQDDMGVILEKILDADLIIWSFPLYYYGMPAMMKKLIERMLPMNSLQMKKVGEHYEHLLQKEGKFNQHMMICGCGFPNATHNFETAVEHFKRMLGENAICITVPETPLLNQPTAEPYTAPFLAAVKQAGNEYGKSESIPVEIMGRLAIPMIPDEIYAQIVNGNV